MNDERVHGRAPLWRGDVLRLGRTLYVGRSGRTNEHGIEQLRDFVAPFGYRVVPVGFTGCLHLKSAASAIGDERVLLNPAWVAAAAFAGCETLAVDAREPHAGNALAIAGSVLHPSQYPRTRERIEACGVRVAPVDCDELAKAEGAVTCCSLVFEVPD